MTGTSLMPACPRRSVDASGNRGPLLPLPTRHDKALSHPYHFTHTTATEPSTLSLRDSLPIATTPTTLPRPAEGTPPPPPPPSLQPTPPPQSPYPVQRKVPLHPHPPYPYSPSTNPKHPIHPTAGSPLSNPIPFPEALFPHPTMPSPSTALSLAPPRSGL